MVTSGSITRSNLFSQSYTNIFNLINNKSNVSDPLGGSSRKMVYKRIPDIKGASFKGYPFIILYPLDVSLDKYLLDLKSAEVVIEFDIEVYSSNRMQGRHSGNGAEYLDQVSEDILETLNSASNKQTLRDYGMSGLMISGESTDDIELKNHKVFVRRIRGSFKQRVGVSS